MTFTKILIANRGEIACRVIRTAQKLGYATVAVFSDADADAPHVGMADQAVRIGSAEIAASYLNIANILTAAEKSGADAIHPGYGFLSESAEFSHQVNQAGLTWIGPDHLWLSLMGNKATAKRMMKLNGVPLIPGYTGEAQDINTLSRAAAEIGYPVMVKASNGGGGRGMRLVNEPDGLTAAIMSARSESLKAFGSDQLFIEKAIFSPRHVEVQIFGDSHGNVIYLGERDCSIQRRHQKVIEEAPSPAVSAELRAKMGAAAVTAASLPSESKKRFPPPGYQGAGTVEFLLDDKDNFYFIEMNTRLQVEHAVTEMISGLDLVEWQLRVAAGEPLPLTQDEVTLDGHAIEVRLYAESAENNFLPSTGTVWHYAPPSGESVRVDDGLRSGQAITPYYDAMIAKIITWGATREWATRRMKRALQETAVLGVDTNRRFLLDTVTHPVFTAGEATTAFIDNTWAPEIVPPSPLIQALAAAVMYETAAQQTGALAGWGSRITTVCFDADDRSRLIHVEAAGDNLTVTVDGTPFSLHLLSCADNCLAYEMDGLRDRASFAFGEDGELWMQSGLETGPFVDVLLAVADSADAVGSGNIVAPMPGAVLRIDVAVGDAVTKGQSLVVLEAMKMEHTIAAPFEGVVAEVVVTVGQQMKPKELMVVVTA